MRQAQTSYFSVRCPGHPMCRLPGRAHAPRLPAARCQGPKTRRTDTNKGLETRPKQNTPRATLVALALGAALVAPLPVQAGDSGQADPATLTDANIAAIVLAANTIDIDRKSTRL